MFCSSLWVGVASIALPLWMFCLLPGVSGCDDLRGDTDFLIPWEPLPLLETYIIKNVYLYNLYKVNKIINGIYSIVQFIDGEKFTDGI